MAELKKIFSRVRLVYRRSQTATKVMLILILVVCIGALTVLRMSMDNVSADTEDLRSKAAELAAENEELEEDITKLGSVQSVVDIAEEELGMVQPGTVILQPEP